MRRVRKWKKLAEWLRVIFYNFFLPLVHTFLQYLKVVSCFHSFYHHLFKLSPLDENKFQKTKAKERRNNYATKQ